MFKNKLSSKFNHYHANMVNMGDPTNASKWLMGFNSAFKGLIPNF
jgi:hypothetical protein